MTAIKNTFRYLLGSPLAEGKRQFARLDGKEIVLFNVDGEMYAIDDSCPHAGASLFNGKLDGYLLTCPAHGLSFDIRSGCMKQGAGFKVRTYQCELIGDTVVDFSDSPTIR